MILTVSCYSAFTGLSALSRGVRDFAFYRFLTGLGVGGQFAVGVALVAEVMSDRARPFALGWLQSLSPVGNMLAALASIVLGKLEKSGAIAGSWRVMFLIGLAPALLAIPIFLRLKEPERWKAAVKEEDKSSPATKQAQARLDRRAFRRPAWRRNTIVGMVLALAGVVGLWGIGFFSFDLIRMRLRQHFQGQGLDANRSPASSLSGPGSPRCVQNAGRILRDPLLLPVTHRIGRKPAFAICFVLAAASTAFTFWFLDEFWQIFVLIPIMGFCQLSLFGGYAIYFPELFPTRLRSTGTSFCYNVGRLVAAAGLSRVLGY